MDGYVYVCMRMSRNRDEGRKKREKEGSKVKNKGKKEGRKEVFDKETNT